MKWKRRFVACEGQEAAARLAAIVEGSEDAIIGWRLDGVITDWNQAATRLYGYSAEEAIGQNALDHRTSSPCKTS